MACQHRGADAELLTVSRLGFGYDRAYLSAAGGGKFVGLDLAETALRETARKNAVPVEEQRRELYKVFQRAYQKQHALEKDS